MKSMAPGKVILSGDHSVVYGAPALSVALQKHTTVTFRPITQSRTLNTLFSGISNGFQYPLNALGQLKQRLDHRFDQFLQGDLPIKRILQQPDDLLIYAVTALMHHLPMPGRATETSYLPMPGRLLSETELPVGAGMGSSASAIAATLVLFEHLLEKPLSDHQRLEMVRFCERLQHGRGSLIDAAPVTLGGLNRIENGQALRQTFALGDHWYWVFTGSPEVSTGECVQNVREHHGHDQPLWDQFSAVTCAFAGALESQSSPIESLNENHALLQHIGVVPTRTQAVVDALQQTGAGAKLSGAGAHKGANGGLVVVYQPDAERITNVLTELSERCPELQWGALIEDPHGARYVND
jgi:mevalonate kinase